MVFSTMNKERKAAYWLISSLVVFVLSVIYYPLNSYFFKFLDLLNACAIAGILVVISYRLGFFWLLWTVSLLLVTTYFKTELLPKFFASWIDLDILAYSASLFCLFTALLIFCESDFLVIKITTVALSAKLLPWMWIFCLFFLCEKLIPHANDFFVAFGVIGSSIIVELLVLKIGFFWIISD